MSRPAPLPPGMVSLGSAAAQVLASATERAAATDAVRERLWQLGYRYVADGGTDDDGRRLIVADGTGLVDRRASLAEAEEFCRAREQVAGARR
jgi:hypothetical protein